MKNLESKINLVIDRIEGDIAVLDGEIKLDLPTKYLPKDAKEGDSLVVIISTDEAETKRKTIKAKELLNEILNNSQK